MVVVVVVCFLSLRFLIAGCFAVVALSFSDVVSRVK